MYLAAGYHGSTNIKTINPVEYIIIIIVGQMAVLCTRFLLCGAVTPLVVAFHLDASQHSLQDAVTLPQSFHGGGNHPGVKDRTHQTVSTAVLQDQLDQSAASRGAPDHWSLPSCRLGCTAPWCSGGLRSSTCGTCAEVEAEEEEKEELCGEAGGCIC